MYISINSIIYLLGAIFSILAVLSSRSNIPSFFSRKRIIRLLKVENKDLDNALKKLRKLYYYEYDAFTVLPIVTIFLVLGTSGVIKFTQDAYHSIIVIVLLVFLSFSLITTSKLPSLYHKNVDEITDSLRKIVDRIKLAETIFISVLLMDVFMTAVSISSNNTTNEILFQIMSILVTGAFVIAYLLFIIAITLRGIERKYLIKLMDEKKLPSLSVKIKLKGLQNIIIGDIVLLDFSNIVIQEVDGYKVGLEYNKVETISAKSNQKNEEMP